jgi:hypothetical protein
MRQDGAQFEGWHYSDSKYQWNSCTSSYYGLGWMNWNNFTEQATRNYGSSGMPTNVLGTVGAMYGVSCPMDWDGDGMCDDGGCKNFTSWTTNNNYMTLYELDRPDPDDLVQSIYFPSTTVFTTCDVYGCAPAESDFVDVSFYQSGPPNQAVDAKFRLRFNFAYYNDGEYCQDLRMYDPMYDCW